MTAPDPLDYRQCAELHKPSDRESLAEEARRLHRQGLKEADLAAILGISIEGVRPLLLTERQS